MRQLTATQCRALDKSGLLKKVPFTDEILLRLQLHQKKQVLTLEYYLKIIRARFGREVSQDEVAFNHDKLLAEYYAAGGEELTTEEFKNYLPENKRYLIGER